MFPHTIDTFARVRPVPDDVAETVDLLNPLPLDVGQDGLKGIEISMNVAKNRSQGRTPYKLRDPSLRGPQPDINSGPNEYEATGAAMSEQPLEHPTACD